MTVKTLAILGGTGFVGSRLTARLGDAGYRIKILTRNRERHRKFLVMPSVQLIENQTLDANSLATQFAGCDAVVNLIGILNGSEQAFQRLHAELPAQIVTACASSGVRRYLHMSALNAEAENGPSLYLRTKGAGEDAAHRLGQEHGVAVTSFQPSVIFGPGDGFFNRFAALLKLSPALPLACPNARFAPVYIDDVVSAFITALNDPNTVDQRYQLCGPHSYTLKELVEYTAQLGGQKRLILGLSDSLSQRQAKVFDFLFKYLPGEAPFSLENYRSMQVDSVCRVDGLAALNVTPTSIESVMPRLFGNGNARARYNRLRSLSRR